jgi:hypothetical protein
LVAVVLTGVGLLRNLRPHSGDTQQVLAGDHPVAASRHPGHGSSEAID